MAALRSAADQDLRERVRAHLARQRALVASLLRLRRQLRGSLFVRSAECGKAGCACRDGRRHGPYYVFSAGGGRGFRNLGPAEARRARGQVERYREFRAGLAALQKVNRALVALLRRYQQRQVRRGARALGVSVPPRP
jgi:hypothetical protein